MSLSSAPATPRASLDAATGIVGDERRGGWRRPEMAAVGALALVAVAVAWAAPTIVRGAGAVGLVAMAAAVALDRDDTIVPVRLVAALGLGVLTLTDAGLAGTAAIGAVPDGTIWRPVVAVVAYPLLGRALLLTVGRDRLFKVSDIVVEAALIGSAAAIALQVVVNRMTRSGGWEPAAPVLSSLLVGLDVALAVVIARPLTSAAARRGPVVVVGASVTALLAGHVIASVRLAGGGDGGAVASLPIAAALLAIGCGCLYDALVERPAIMPEEAPAFSAAHAAIVVLAVIASPVVLALQVAWDVSVSGAVAVGAGLIGVVLAVHIVDLLRERADNEHHATHDPLTGLPNRVLFMDRLERAIAHAERNDVPVGVLYIDLDRFKDVNDTFGHGAGDELLREAAGRLGECARHEDTVARLSGDEFAVLLPHLRAGEDVSVVAGRILDALRRPVELDGTEVFASGSVGAAVYPSDGTTAAALLSAADAAMYRAKDRGGSGVELHSAELQGQARKRLELETALHRAIHGGELVLHYQPIVEADTGRTCGAEALVRWSHPERGMVPPNDFIPVAEQSDLIIDLGNWVIRTACEQLARWASLGLGDRFVTVNVSPRHFRDDLASSITRALRETGADPTRLVVELTETAAVDDVALVADRMRELRQLGVKAAIDDFGTGYCGLQYLGDLPVSTLKLDRSFVQSMTPSNAAIVAATIAMSRTLGLTMVAEGVETEEQQRFLTSQGCHRLQGYHLGRPMPAEDLVARLQAEDATPAGLAAPQPSTRPAVPPATTTATRPPVAAAQPAR